QILASASGTSTITLTAVNGFTGTISLSISASTPTGLSCPTLASVTFGTSPQTATLSCSASAAGDYSVTVSGSTSSAGPPSTASILFHIVNFTIQPSTPVTVSGGSGTSITQVITLNAQNGLTGDISLAASASTPPGLTCTLASSVTFGTGSQT